MRSVCALISILLFAASPMVAQTPKYNGKTD